MRLDVDDQLDAVSGQGVLSSHMGPGEAKGGDGWGCTAHHPFRPDTCEFMAQRTPVH